MSTAARVGDCDVSSLVASNGSDETPVIASKSEARRLVARRRKARGLVDLRILSSAGELIGNVAYVRFTPIGQAWAMLLPFSSLTDEDRVDVLAAIAIKATARASVGAAQ